MSIVAPGHPRLRRISMLTAGALQVLYQFFRPGLNKYIWRILIVESLTQPYVYNNYIMYNNIIFR